MRSRSGTCIVVRNVDPGVYERFYRVKDEWRRRRRCTGDNAEFLSWLLSIAEAELSRPVLKSY